ncbi:long-acyl-chain ceramide synthase [Klebsormidium nitens]|uniref:Long-acyl-chain ceramide synthase n=1 Tax=Klebsormidium nitens TaxID=105231 RepID=A0A1Y1HLJ4_KLENI|nr:long-acyl-chain ceramide synthase [Klebsormidium nitens]|eukprot:GAQ79490.1 long-acyl-chain ceramide synthase [Klebsormidium nitens]
MQAPWIGQESYPVWQDLKYALFFACAYPVLQKLLYVTIFDMAARATVDDGKKPVNKVAAERKEVAVRKYKESAWKLLFYALAWSYGVYITYDKEWWITKGTLNFWKGWPEQKMRMDLKLFYASELGFYSYGIVFLLLWETKRKDFGVMTIHHIGTLVLISYSYFTGFVRVGNMVLLAHDISDILLEGAKLFKYSKNEIGASVTFALFAISWLVFRLIYYPTYLIRSTAFEAQKAFLENRTVAETVVYYYCFNTFLIMLLVLHVYWFYLIGRMIVKQVQNSGAVGDDVRSDSDDD